MEKAAVPSILVVVVLLVVAVIAEAQQAGKIFRIGYLDDGTAALFIAHLVSRVMYHADRDKGKCDLHGGSA